MTNTPRILALAAIVFSPSGAAPTAPTGAGRIRALFANPPAEFSTAPLWVWNDRLTDDMVIGTLRDLAAQNVKQAFVHPRPGLMTPYLSAEWFRLWKVALAEAARLDMKLWIYDENSYPSGFAGGFVPDAMPESRGLGLGFQETASPTWSEDTLAVFRISDGAYADVSREVRAGAAAPPSRYLVASRLLAKPSPWYGGRFYVDLLRTGVTERFLSITMDAYKREIGAASSARACPGADRHINDPHTLPASVCNSRPPGQSEGYQRH